MFLELEHARHVQLAGVSAHAQTLVTIAREITYQPDIYNTYVRSYVIIDRMSYMYIYRAQGSHTQAAALTSSSKLKL